MHFGIMALMDTYCHLIENRDCSKTYHKSDNLHIKKRANQFFVDINTCRPP